jgi:hypothetical protein
MFFALENPWGWQASGSSLASPFSSSDLCGLCGLGVVFFFVLGVKEEQENHTETAETAEIGGELKQPETRRRRGFMAGC